MQDLRPFFTPGHFIETKGPGTYEPLQWGANIQCFTSDQFNWEDADIIILGCGEQRGDDPEANYSNSPDAIREQLYNLYSWHSAVKIADAGNIRQGETVDDTRAALRIVLEELQQAGKTVIVLGGSHDLTFQQYEAFKRTGKMINASVADMLIDLDETEAMTSKSFLMDMLTAQPNFVKHYSHIGFQSYYAHPRMLETLDKLRFDFFRLGKVRDHIEDMEPVLRNSELFSFDMNAIRYSDAPVNVNGSPNGFTGDEACVLTRFAGMSDKLSSLGIYGYDAANDTHNMTARLISQMIWYFIDGYLVRKTEAELHEHEEFVVFHVSFTDNDTTFLKSKRTNRWWMKLPNQAYVPCSYKDYMLASSDEIPERWLREQERLL
ncbi:formimidoylglutamase [Polluticoccus soli]|uniref:formimidoylglutamase n=1 Tax=Polluticoccus soli TaxID=3034150 RepID=UPI0023E1BE27|nr:formimidoylglutamase [Flavipsychrobacter sp. JY13-12]